jgi:hypothetical protein
VLVGARQQRTLALTTRLVDGILGLVVFHGVRTARTSGAEQCAYACPSTELREADPGK